MPSPPGSSCGRAVYSCVRSCRAVRSGVGGDGEVEGGMGARVGEDALHGDGRRGEEVNTSGRRREDPLDNQQLERASTSAGVGAGEIHTRGWRRHLPLLRLPEVEENLQGNTLLDASHAFSPPLPLPPLSIAYLDAAIVATSECAAACLNPTVSTKSLSASEGTLREGPPGNDHLAAPPPVSHRRPNLRQGGLSQTASGGAERAVGTDDVDVDEEGEAGEREATTSTTRGGGWGERRRRGRGERERGDGDGGGEGRGRGRGGRREGGGRGG